MLQVLWQLIRALGLLVGVVLGKDFAVFAQFDSDRAWLQRDYSLVLQVLVVRR